MGAIERAGGVAEVVRTATIDLNQFGGLSPRTEPRLLRDTMATEALDVNLLHGDLRPRRTPLAAGVQFPAGTQTIYNHCGDWLGFPGKVYIAESLGSDDRVYIAGDGVPRVRECDGNECPLGVPAPTTAPDYVLEEADLADYSFRFFGWYEGPDGTVYDRTEVFPTREAIAKTYLVNTFASTSDLEPKKLSFCLSMEVSKAGDLLGVVYSDNSFRSGNSDLYLLGQKATLRLRNRPGLAGTDSTAYTTDTPPAQLVMRILYESGDAAHASRSYVYTYVREWTDGTTDESAPSPPTEVFAVDASEQVVLSGFIDPGSPCIHLIRIYRTDSAGTFRFVDEIPVNQATFTDDLLATELGETLSSTDWLPPPDDMAGLVTMPNGFMIGFAGNTLYPSAVNQEHAYPAAFTKVIKGEKIVGIAGAFENSLVVVTKCHPYIVTAYSPDNLTVTKVNAQQPCMSALSIVDMGRYGVGYASNHGFVLVRAGDAPVMSEPFYTSEQWQALKPERMRSGWHHETLHVVSDVEHLVWDMSEGEDVLTRSSYLPTAMWDQCAEQRLWVVIDGLLHEWEAGPYGRFIWRGKETTYSRPIDYVRAIVESEGEVTLRLIADDMQMYERTFDSEEPFALPVLPRSKHWYLEIEAGVETDRVTVTNQHGRL